MFLEKFAELKGKKEYFTILLSHRPEQFRAYVENKIDLVLSGHAHGGQIRTPFIGVLIDPNQVFLSIHFRTLPRKKTSMIVMRGLGNSVIPLRVNNPPEIVLVTLQKK